MGGISIWQSYERYHHIVNMTARELADWASNPLSHKASLSRDPIHRNLYLLSKPEGEWTEGDAYSARRTVNFIKRMRGVVGGRPVSKDTFLSKKVISLLNWAYDPNKPSGRRDYRGYGFRR